MRYFEERRMVNGGRARLQWVLRDVEKIIRSWRGLQRTAGTSTGVAVNERLPVDHRTSVSPGRHMARTSRITARAHKVRGQKPKGSEWEWEEFGGEVGREERLVCHRRRPGVKCKCIASKHHYKLKWRVTRALTKLCLRHVGMFWQLYFLLGDIMWRAEDQPNSSRR
jgi:hypothetical protein